MLNFIAKLIGLRPRTAMESPKMTSPPSRCLEKSNLLKARETILDRRRKEKKAIRYRAENSVDNSNF